jgi:hypothetical protein
MLRGFSAERLVPFAQRGETRFLTGDPAMSDRKKECIDQGPPHACDETGEYGQVQLPEGRTLKQINEAVRRKLSIEHDRETQQPCPAPPNPLDETVELPALPRRGK